jgi:hypothetical protein
MSLRDLSTPTMVTIIAAWLDPERERKDIEALKKAAFLLPTLEEAKAELLATQASTNTATPVEITAVQKEQAEIDGTHDRKSRGIHGALTAFAELVDDPDKAAKYLALRDKMFPQGLAVVKWSYTDEAGEAELVESRLTPQDHALLKQLPYPGGKLNDAHEARIAAGRKLGDLERKKQTLIQAHESKEGKVGLADVAKARNGWIRTVRAFVGMIDLEKNLSSAIRHKILGPLEEAERKASKRGGKPETEEPKEDGKEDAKES